MLPLIYSESKIHSWSAQKVFPISLTTFQDGTMLKWNNNRKLDTAKSTAGGKQGTISSQFETKIQYKSILAPILADK
jgi:hypothetical protein